MDSLLFEKLFDIEGLSCEDNAAGIEIQNRLGEVLLSRLNKCEVPFKTRDVVSLQSEMRNDTFYGRPTRVESPISSGFCEKYPDWSWSALNLSAECNVDTWNTYSGFTWDVFYLSIIGYSLLFSSGGIEDVTNSNIDNALDYFQEQYFCDTEEEELYDDENMKEELYLLLYDIQNAVREGETSNSYLKKMAEDFCKLFGEMISIENVLHNFEFILNFCFGICDGAERTLLVFGNKNIPSYLKEKCDYSHEEQSLLDKAIDCISNPFCEYGGAFLDCMYPQVIQDKEWYTVFIPIGSYEDHEITEFHFRPFYHEAAECISKCLSKNTSI